MPAPGRVQTVICLMKSRTTRPVLTALAGTSHLGRTLLVMTPDTLIQDTRTPDTRTPDTRTPDIRTPDIRRRDTLMILSVPFVSQVCSHNSTGSEITKIAIFFNCLLLGQFHDNNLSLFEWLSPHSYLLAAIS